MKLDHIPPSPSKVHPLSATMAPTTPASKAGSKPRSSISLARVKGENFYRDAKKVNRLKMLNGGKAVRDKDGKIIQAAAFQKGEDEAKPGRVQPDRRWFGAYIFMASRKRFPDLGMQEILE